MPSFMEYMNTAKPVNKWFLAGAFVMGAFAGALLTFVWMISGLL